MGYRNSIDSEKMEIESSSFTASPLANHSLQLNPETACTAFVSDFNLPSIKWSLDESTSTIGGTVEDVAFCDIMEDNLSKVPHILLETKLDLLLCNFYEVIDLIQTTAP